MIITTIIINWNSIKFVIIKYEGYSCQNNLTDVQLCVTK